MVCMHCHSVLLSPSWPETCLCLLPWTTSLAVQPTAALLFVYLPVCHCISLCLCVLLLVYMCVCLSVCVCARMPLVISASLCHLLINMLLVSLAVSLCLSVCVSVCVFRMPLGISASLRHLLINMLKRNAADRIEFGMSSVLLLTLLHPLNGPFCRTTRVGPVPER